MIINTDSFNDTAESLAYAMLTALNPQSYPPLPPNQRPEPPFFDTLEDLLFLLLGEIAQIGGGGVDPAVVAQIQTDLDALEQLVNTQVGEIDALQTALAALQQAVAALAQDSHTQNTDTGTDKQAFVLGSPDTPGTRRDLQAEGDEQDIDLFLAPKGDGLVGSPTWAGTGERVLLADPDGKSLPWVEKERVVLQNLWQVLVVSEAGDDATAARGNHNKPFQTVEAAYDAALGNDLIWVVSGTHLLPFNVFNKPVHWRFEANTTVADNGDTSGPVNTGYNQYFLNALSFVSEGTVRIDGNYPTFSVPFFRIPYVRFNRLFSTGGIMASYFTPAVLIGNVAEVAWPATGTGGYSNVFDWTDSVDIRSLKVNFNGYAGNAGLFDFGNNTATNFYRFGHLQLSNHAGPQVNMTGSQQLYMQVSDRLIMENLQGYLRMGMGLQLRLPVVITAGCPNMRLQLNGLNSFNPFGFSLRANLELADWPFAVEMVSNTRYDCNITARRLGAISALNTSNLNQMGGKLLVTAAECGAVTVGTAFAETTLDVARINGPVVINYNGANGAPAAPTGVLRMPRNTHIQLADASQAAITLGFNPAQGVNQVTFQNLGNVTTNSVNPAPFRFLNGNPAVTEPFANDPKHTTKGYYVDAGIVTLETGGLPSRGIYHNQPALA